MRTRGEGLKNLKVFQMSFMDGPKEEPAAAAERGGGTRGWPVAPRAPSARPRTMETVAASAVSCGFVALNLFHAKQPG